MRATCLIGAITATALVATGCGGGDETPVATRSATSAQSAPAAVPPPAAAPATATPKGVLGGRDGQFDGDPVRLEILELVRSGATSSITIQLTTEGEDSRAQIAGALDDGISDDDNGNEYDTADGISLIDATNRKRYLVARDSSGRCVCDNDLSGTFVEPAGPTVLSATFGAPPPDVKAVDVVIPKYGTFKNVPFS